MLLISVMEKEICSYVRPVALNSFYTFYRRRRMSFVMRSRGLRQRKRSWSSNWKPWMHNLASCLPLLQSPLHLHLRARPQATNWCLSLVTQGLQCGSLCHRLQWIPHRITYSAHRWLNLAAYNALGRKTQTFVFILSLSMPVLVWVKSPNL